MTDSRTGPGTDRTLQLLERRVERLELLVVQVACWLTGACLAIGAVLPYLPVAEGSDEDDVMARLVSVGFETIAWRNSEGEADGFSIAVGIGFLGLLACAVLAAWSLFVIGSATATERSDRLVRVVATLLAIGTGVAGIFFLVGAGSDEVDAGPGLPVFAVGVAGFLAITLSGLRDWARPPSRSRRF